LAYYRTVHKNEDNRDRLFLRNDDLHGEYFTTVILKRRYGGLRQQLRNVFLGTYCGLTWVSFEPHFWDEPDDDGAIGYWIVRGATVAIVPPAWQAELIRGDVRQIVDPTRRDLAFETASAFRYPTRWMNAQTSIIAQLFNLTKNFRWFSSFGTMRNPQRQSHSTRGHLCNPQRNSSS
jgi:hypothetical protein